MGGALRGSFTVIVTRSDESTVFKPEIPIFWDSNHYTEYDLGYRIGYQFKNMQKIHLYFKYLIY